MTVFDCGEITIIQQFKRDFLKLEATRSDEKLKFPPIMRGKCSKFDLTFFANPALASWKAGRAKMQCSIQADWAAGHAGEVLNVAEEVAL